MSIITKIQNKITKSAYLLISAVLLLAVLVPSFVGRASALQLTARKLTLGSSVASASTSYQFDFTTATTATFQSFAADICTTASGACSTPAGFTVTGSAFTSSTLAGSWTINTATPGSLRATASGATSTTSGTAKNMILGSVTNPSATNATFFARITLYSDTGWATPVDTGTVAASTAGQITVTATVDEALTFTLASATVALGTLTSSTTGSGTSTMTASTNGVNGYAITVNGATLTSGANTITALAANAASTQNSSQFGLNLVSNTVPTVGTNVSGAGSGTAATNYNTTNSFRFGTGETVASAAGATNSNTFTVSYIANVPATQAPGSYSATLTYIATATF